MHRRLAATATCGFLALTGCGNWITTDIIGVVGAKTDRSHSVQLLLNTCSRAYDEVLLFGPHKGPRTKPDVPIGIWRAQTPFHHDTVLNIDHPGTAWQVRRDPGQLAPGTMYVVEAGSTTQDQELSQVSFTLDQLDHLKPGEVHIYGRQVMQQTKFDHTERCVNY